MIELEIENKQEYIYHLIDKNKKSYEIELEFLDIEEKPKTGDYIYINKELLNPMYDGYSTNYTFGNLGNKYGKEKLAKDDIDIIKIVMDKKEIYLKRLYG